MSLFRRSAGLSRSLAPSLSDGVLYYTGFLRRKYWLFFVAAAWLGLAWLGLLHMHINHILPNIKVKNYLAACVPRLSRGSDSYLFDRSLFQKMTVV